MTNNLILVYWPVYQHRCIKMKSVANIRDHELLSFQNFNFSQFFKKSEDLAILDLYFFIITVSQSWVVLSSIVQAFLFSFSLFTFPFVSSILTFSMIHSSGFYTLSSSLSSSFIILPFGKRMWYKHTR